MLVTAIIPTYNRADLLRESLASVFSQTYKDIQIIVVDDGSTDDTHQVLDELADRVQSIRLGRGGTSIARNQGIQKAEGEYIAFLDSDDLWHPEKIEKHVAFASAHPEMALTYTDALEFSDRGPDRKSYVQKSPALNNPSNLFAAMIDEFALPLTSATMIRKSFLKENDLRFPESIAIVEDLGLFLQILMAGGSFGYLPEQLTRRRMHDSNVSGNHRRRFEQRKALYRHLLSKYVNRYTDDQKSALKRGLRDATYRVAECDWEDLDLASARTGFKGAIYPDAKGIHALIYCMLTALPPSLIAAMRNAKN